MTLKGTLSYAKVFGTKSSRFKHKKLDQNISYTFIIFLYISL